MRIVKLVAGILLLLVAIGNLIGAFSAAGIEIYEKLAAFFIAGAIAFWLLYSIRKTKT